jgi:hypothetical protein
MTQPVESELEIARRHVREGEARVARQEEIVADLERAGHTKATEHGRMVLETIGISLTAMEAA